MGFEGRRKPVVIHTLWLMETPLQLGPAPGTAGWLLPSPRTSASVGHSAVCVAARRAAIPYPLLLSGKPFCVWTRVQMDTAGPGSHSAAPCVTEAWALGIPERSPPAKSETTHTGGTTWERKLQPAEVRFSKNIIPLANEARMPFYPFSNDNWCIFLKCAWRSLLNKTYPCVAKAVLHYVWCGMNLRLEMGKKKKKHRHVFGWTEHILGRKRWLGSEELCLFLKRLKQKESRNGTGPQSTHLYSTHRESAILT